MEHEIRVQAKEMSLSVRIQIKQECTTFQEVIEGVEIRFSAFFLSPS